MPLDPEMSSRQQERRQEEQRGKIIFRSLVILFAIIGLILQSLVAVQSTRSQRGGYYYYYDNVWFSPESFTFVSSSHKNRLAKANDDGSKFGISLIWCTAELITMRINKRGIHPGALVGVDLILWMGFLGAGLTEILINIWNKTSVAAGALGLTCRCVFRALFHAVLERSWPNFLAQS
jgi:hypothetical protein